jgi:hypothetical protein
MVLMLPLVPKAGQQIQPLTVRIFVMLDFVERHVLFYSTSTLFQPLLTARTPNRRLLRMDQRRRQALQR